VNDTTKTTLIVKGRVQCHLEIKALEADLERVRATKDDAQPAWREAETRLAQGIEAIKRIAESLGNIEPAPCHKCGGSGIAQIYTGQGELQREQESCECTNPPS